MSEANPAEHPHRAEQVDLHQQLSDELAAARKRIDELARAYQAGEQDRESFKLRLQRERERMLDIERADIALILIETVDELDLSLSADRGGSPLHQGVKLIRDKVLKKLEVKGIERVELLGQDYDPAFAEAADTELTTDRGDDGKIVAVLRAAYRLKDRVIRPGRVQVARFVQPALA